MPERVRLTVDGRGIPADADATVAAALGNAGVDAWRTSVSGEKRGALCAMGICFECRVTVDGEAHRRACLERVRDGMAVATGGSPPPASRVAHSPSSIPAERVQAEVAVVGAGPAGIAAACRAAESGAPTIVLDDGLAAGGQIHRHRPGTEPPPAARAWHARLARSGARVLSGVSVVDAAPDGDGFFLSAERGDRALAVRARRVVIATGARELFLPFPGWTLPGVMGAGGAQALWKSGASLAGRTAVVGGSGPLLLPAASSLAKAGARVALVAEQAGYGAVASFAAGLVRTPAKILEALRYGLAGASYRAGSWIAEARGDGALASVVVTDGRARREIRCDLAAVGWGLVGNLELARLLGCRLDAGGVAVDSGQETSVAGVFAAGEPCGVAGLEAAVAEGQIAGLAAAGRADEARSAPLAAARAKARRFGVRLERAFALREELRALAAPDTIVCRCEDVRLDAVAGSAGPREAKLVSRAGMGACQGRVCGPALRFLFGWESDTVRPPVGPARLGHLAATE
ncbi:MAG TPA: FAD-dependent oxidoreductase [Thermoanaerobaculia bacterium]|nr:FAD-dependent oxidoreductase [Thermoanaerobaculia bacterium]